MLIEKSLEKDDIVAVKLMSGEELIAKFVSITPNDRLQISKPIVLGMQQQQDPQTGKIEVGMGFAPFMLGIDDAATVTLESGSYITMIKARDEIKQAYIQSTTGLAVPPTSSVIV